MRDGAARRHVRREVFSAKLRPDDQVGARLPRVIFYHTRRDRAMQ